MTMIFSKTETKLNTGNAVLMYCVPDESHPIKRIVGKPFSESLHIDTIKYQSELELYI